MPKETADIGGIAEVLATYGVYGLIPLLLTVWYFLIRRQQRATNPDERTYLRRIANVVLTGFLVLNALAAGLWTWVELKPAEPWVRGTFAKLYKNHLVGHERVSQQVDFLARSVFTAEEPGRRPGRFRVRWVTPEPGDATELTIEVQEQRSRERLAPPDKDPSGRGDAPRARSRIVAKNYYADVPLINGSTVLYWHTRHPKHAPKGGFVFRQGAEKRYISFETDPLASNLRPGAVRMAGLARSILSWLGPAAAYADGGPPGPEVVGPLLGSQDLGDQRMGRSMLQQAGAAAYSTFDELLTRLRKRPTSRELYPELVVHNLRLFLEQSDPGHQEPERWAELAHAYYWIDDHELAARLFRIADEKFTKSGRSMTRWRWLYAWGVSMRELGEPEAAHAKLEACLELARKPCQRASVLATMAYTYGRRSASGADEVRARTEKKLRLYEQAHSLCPDHPRTNNNLAWMLAKRAEPGDLERALDLVTQALAAKPDNPDYLDTKGVVLCASGRREEGADWLGRAIAAGAGPTSRAHQQQCSEGLPLNL